MNKKEIKTYIAFIMGTGFSPALHRFFVIHEIRKKLMMQKISYILMSFCLLGCNVQSNGETYYSIDKTKAYTQPSTTQEFIGGFVDSVTQTTYPDSWNKKVSTGSYVIMKLKSVQNDQVYPCLIKPLGAHDLVVESCITG